MNHKSHLKSHIPSAGLDLVMQYLLSMTSFNLFWPPYQCLQVRTNPVAKGLYNYFCSLETEKLNTLMTISMLGPGLCDYDVTPGVTRHLLANTEMVNESKAVQSVHT